MRDRPLAGAALMVAGMLTFPIGDAIAKYLSADYSIFLLAWARLAFGALIAVPLAIVVAKLPPKIDARLIIEQTLRTILAVLAIVFFIAALARIPLADVVGAYLTAPLFAALLAALILGERITYRILAITLFGFIGAILIIRPGASMDIGSLYALAAGASFGGFLVVTRWAIRDVQPLLSVAFQTGLGALLLLPFAAPEIGGISGAALPWMLLMGLGSATANILIIAALRLASASLLAPLAYAEIIGATVLGYAVFGDIPTTLTWLGMAIVVASGLMLITHRAA